MVNVSEYAGFRLAALRRSRGVSITELSDFIKCNPASLSTVESGKRKLTKRNRELVSKYFNVPVEYFDIKPDCLEELERITITSDPVDFLHAVSIVLHGMGARVALRQDRD